MSTMIIATEKGFLVQGPIAFDNVIDLRFQGETVLATLSHLSDIEIDLSEMKDQDASSISLLLCWIRFSKKNKLHFMHASQSLQRMINMFGLRGII